MTYIEVANPSRSIINKKEDYMKFIKLNNGVTNLYRTVFGFKYLKDRKHIDYESAIVNQMFFDCDSKNSLKVCRSFHEDLIKDDIKHYMKQSSTMKFHIYVICKVQDLDNKKNALYNGMIYFADKLNFTYGRSDISDLDKATFGDLARICPIAGTYKPKRNSYCSYISSEDLYSEELLLERSRKGNGKLKVYGSKEFDLKPFDVFTPNNSISSNMVVDNDDFDVEFNSTFIECLPPFVKKVLSNYNGYCDDYRNRWRVGLYMRDIGYSESQTKEILKEYYTKHINTTSLNGRGTQWDRYMKCKALWYTYHGEFREFPTVRNLLEEGWEITKEDEELIGKLYG